MFGFCGALNTEHGQVSFSALKRMCGMHGEGCAYINREMGLLCDSQIEKTGDSQQLLTVRRNDFLYTAAVAQSTHISARSVLELYFEEGDEFVHRLNSPSTLCLYDARLAELTLLRSTNSNKPMFFARREGVLYFASALRPLIRLYGGCVRINGRVLLSYLREPSAEFPEGLFCDIVNIPEGHLLIASTFGETLVPFAEHALPEKASEHTSAQYAFSDIRRVFTEEVFEHCYPYCSDSDFENFSKKENKRAEKQLDTIIGEYRAFGRGIFANKEVLSVLAEYEGEKSTPLRLRKKGVLCKTAIWFDGFNLVVC